jgi:HEAT repeat protein
MRERIVLKDDDMARLETAVASERWEQRREGLRLLGSSRDPRALAVIRTCLDDPNSEVGVAAVVALGALGSSDGIPDLIAELQNLFRNRRRRREALLGLGKLGDPVVIPELARVLEGPDHYVKDAAIASLTEFGEKALPVLTGRLDVERDIALRLLLAFALVQLGDLRGLPIFSEVLADHVASPDRWDPKAIAAVVVAVGEHRQRPALPALRILARDVRFDRMFPGLAHRAIRAIEGTPSGLEDTMGEGVAPLPRPPAAGGAPGAGADEEAAPGAATGEEAVPLDAAPGVDEDSDTPPAAFVVASAAAVDEDADTPVPGPGTGANKEP